MIRTLAPCFLILGLILCIDTAQDSSNTETYDSNVVHETLPHTDEQCSAQHTEFASEQNRHKHGSIGRWPKAAVGVAAKRDAAAERLPLRISDVLPQFVSGTIEQARSSEGDVWQHVLARRRRKWDHHMEFETAVAMGSAVTAQAFVTLHTNDNAESALAIGTKAGAVYLFHLSGHLSFELQTGGGPVTAIAAVLRSRSNLTLLTGDSDGCVHLHAITLGSTTSNTSNSSNNAIRKGAVVEAVNLMVLNPYQGPNAAATTHNSVTGNSDTSPTPARSAVRHLLTLANRKVLRFAAILDDGSITVWSHKGLLQQWARAPSPVLAARWSEASITMITSSGGAALLTHSFRNNSQPVVRSKVCEGLGFPQPQLAAAVFDVQHPVHVYGITANTGRLLHVFLGNGKTFRNCRVLSSQEVQLGPFSDLTGGRVTVAALQQHLIAASRTKIAVWDIRQRSSLSTRLFTDSIATVKSSINMQAPMMRAPVLTSGMRGPVAVGMEAGVIALYLPAHLNIDVQRDLQAFEAWTQPLLSIIMLLAVAYQIARARRRARARHAAAVPSFPQGLQDIGASQGGLRGVTMPKPTTGNVDTDWAADELNDEALAEELAELTLLMNTDSIRKRTGRNPAMSDFR